MSGCDPQSFPSPVPLSSSQHPVCFVCLPSELGHEQTLQPICACGCVCLACSISEWRTIYILICCTSRELEIVMSPGPRGCSSQYFLWSRKRSNFCGQELEWEHLRASRFTILSYSRGKQGILKIAIKHLSQNNHHEWATPVPEQKAHLHSYNFCYHIS